MRRHLRAEFLGFLKGQFAWFGCLPLHRRPKIDPLQEEVDRARAHLARAVDEFCNVILDSLAHDRAAADPFHPAVIRAHAPR